MASFTDDEKLGREIVARKLRELADHIESGELEMEECRESLGTISYFTPEEEYVEAVDDGMRRITVLYKDPKRAAEIEEQLSGMIPGNFTQTPPE